MRLQSLLFTFESLRTYLEASTVHPKACDMSFVLILSALQAELNTNNYSPTASQALNGSAHISQCPILPCLSNPLKR